jgi:acyl dehydratase
VQGEVSQEQPGAANVLDALRAKIGAEVGRSDWVLVDQAMIDRFADLTDDHQFIHVDVERAASTPLGGTIAHGFLVLSLLPMLLKQAGVRAPGGLAMSFNYGMDRLRFVSPVHAGRRVRGLFSLASAREKRPGQIEQILDVTIEVEGAEKPAVVGTWVSLLIVAG